MGNWNRHFVRVGSDGNVGIFDPTGYEVVEIDGTSNGGNYFKFIAQNPSLITRNINPITVNFLIGGQGGNGQIQGAGWAINGYGSSLSPFTQYNNLTTAMNAFGVISGSPDLRTGVTAADASPKTIFSSTTSGVRYEVKARILATSGSSATYTISWTEGGVAQTVALTITAVDTEVHDNFVIAPDAGTNITAQITALTSSTVNVDAIVSVLG